jgi:hypothetical protein
MEVRWCRTVVSLMFKRDAISLFRSPSAMSARMPRSRAVSAAIPSAAPLDARDDRASAAAVARLIQYSPRAMHPSARISVSGVG